MRAAAGASSGLEIILRKRVMRMTRMKKLDDSWASGLGLQMRRNNFATFSGENADIAG